MPSTGDTRREYLRAYQRAWLAARRTAWIKEHGPCAHCGSWEALEIDHIDRSQKQIRSSQLWSLSPGNPARVTELAKCQVLCIECHVEKTNKDFNQGVITHGTHSSYSNYDCRCTECRAAHAKAAREYRKNGAVAPETHEPSRKDSVHVKRKQRRRKQGLRP